MTLPKFQTKYLPNLVEIGWMVSKSITDIETFFVFYIYRLFYVLLINMFVSSAIAQIDIYSETYFT